ncbi:histidine ammonia-lyase/phenylalanine ammonia-lyase [Actinokineospora baliensis]|uniref:HAL/PAL/TAL family ammonia-lyase n=1 Tax=Actinokineospora baliensis TaxID=547056 RepID=UPI0027DBC482|nr:aromatic amino acid ammonia-lyase [Actinokineospora baliensis]MBM7774778.1 histidine ammonia-lyase/phenylalanine ammonia-lyase [Actinokineospora baliensis]
MSGPVLGDDSLRPGQVADLARSPGARPALSARSRAAMAESVRLRDAVIASGRAVYGVTTGFGDSGSNQLAPALAADLQRSLIQYHLVGSGPAAADDTVRATMLIRANCLARGYSGIRAEVVDLLLDLLAHDLVPVVPERGSVGASGDLIPLCYIADVLTGGGEVRHRGERMPAAAAMRSRGLTPARLGPKEALALINGTSFMSAFAVLAAADAEALAVIAEACTALAVEAVRGYSGAFAPFPHDHKPHPGQRRSAESVAAALAGSELVTDDAGAPAPSGNGRLPRPVQDRYSLRCAPQVIGVLRDTLTWVDQWLRVEICSTNDNPLFDPAGAAVHNAGNFYGGHVGLAMDTLKTAVASVADLLDRQLASVVDERYSNGLPANLAPVDPAGPWLDHGFKGVQIAASALAAEALKLGTPATAFSRSTEAHNQDKVSMGTIAARDARTVVDLTFDLAALHLAALCQAVELRGPALAGAGSRAVFDAVRGHVGFLSRDRRLDTELAALTEALRDGLITKALAPLQPHPEAHA